MLLKSMLRSVSDEVCFNDDTGSEVNRLSLKFKIRIDPNPAKTLSDNRQKNKHYANGVVRVKCMFYNKDYKPSLNKDTNIVIT